MRKPSAEASLGVGDKNQRLMYLQISIARNGLFAL